MIFQLRSVGILQNYGYNRSTENRLAPLGNGENRYIRLRGVREDGGKHSWLARWSQEVTRCGLKCSAKELSQFARETFSAD